MNTECAADTVTLKKLKHQFSVILNEIETLTLPTAGLFSQLQEIKYRQTRIMNAVSLESTEVYSGLHNFDPENLLMHISTDTAVNPQAPQHEKQIYEFLIGQLNTVYHSVNRINKQFNLEYDSAAVPLLQGDLLNQQSYLDKTVENYRTNIDKFTSDKSYWEEKLAVIIQSEEIIHQRGFRSMFGPVNVPSPGQLKNVELSSSERFILDELYRIVSAIINSLADGMSYIQLVESRTSLSQRIYDLTAVIRKLNNELFQLCEQSQEVTRALTLLPGLTAFDNRVSSVLIYWLQSVQRYEPYLAGSPLPGELEQILPEQRHYFSAFTGLG